MLILHIHHLKKEKKRKVYANMMWIVENTISNLNGSKEEGSLVERKRIEPNNYIIVNINK